MGQDCNFIQDKVDEFTGDTIKTIWLKATGGLFSPSIQMIFRRVNKTHFIDLSIADSQRQLPNLAISKGSKLYLKLENDSMIILESFKDEIGISQISNGVLLRTIKPSYYVRNEDLYRMQESDLKKMRIDFIDAPYDCAIKEGDITNRVVSCILYN